MADPYKTRSTDLFWDLWELTTSETAHLISLCKNRHDIRFTVNSRALYEAERQKELRRRKKNDVLESMG